MRNRFVAHLKNKIELGHGENIVVMTGDLGFSVLEPVRELLGHRFINVGIAESLMASQAAGIACDGYKVFIYSIMPFATFRCLEQIRNDICYHNKNVTVVGIGAGYGYGSLGPTHHSLEDLSAMWALPNLKVFSPGDIREADWCFEENFNYNGPSYLRLGKGGEGVLNAQSIISGNGIVSHFEGKDGVIVLTGHILEEAIILRQQLASTGKDFGIISMAQLKPFDSEGLIRSLSANRVIVLEELNPYGGFSGQVSKSILESETHKNIRFMSLSVKDQFAKTVGSYKFQRKENGIAAEQIFEKMKVTGFI